MKLTLQHARFLAVHAFIGVLALTPASAQQTGTLKASTVQAAGGPKNELGSPQEVQDAGDHYFLPGNRRVDLRRVNDEVVVKLRISPQKKGRAIAEFQADHARKSGLQFNKKFTIKAGKAATDEEGLQLLSASNARASLDALKADPAVEKVMPVYLNPATGKRMIANPEVLVVLNEGVEIAGLAAALAQAGLTAPEAVGSSRMRCYKLSFASNAAAPDVLAAARSASALNGVKAAEPNFTQEIELFDSNTRANPNDPYYGRLQHLDNEGQNGATAHEDVGAPTAWQRLMGGTSSNLAEAGTAWVSSMSVQSGDLVYYASNLYQATATTTLGSTAPVHVSGTTGNLRWMRKRPVAWPATGLAIGDLLAHQNNVYEATTAGNTHTTTAPLHIQGTVANGGVNLRFVSRRVPVVAIVDTGIDVGTISGGRYTNGHPDLSIYDNLLETASNGADDGDPGSLIDDVSGWDFYLNPGDNNPQPGTTAGPGHGTACAGVAAGRINNSQGGAGAAPGAPVLPIKITDDAGTFASDDRIAAAISYAADYADVISCSFGGGLESTAINVAITDASTANSVRRGRLVFVSTGNSASRWGHGGSSRRSLRATGFVGTYRFGFRFEKNTATTAGEDRALIDNVALLDDNGNRIALPLMGANGTQSFEGTGIPANWSMRGSDTAWTTIDDNAGTPLDEAFSGAGGVRSIQSPVLSAGSSSELRTPQFTVAQNFTLVFNAVADCAAGDQLRILFYDNAGVELYSFYVNGSASGRIVNTNIAFPAYSTDSIPIGASTDCAVRSPYSQFGAVNGRGVQFVAPSNEGFNEITTTDVRSSSGRNDGGGTQAVNADYDSTFGGTSSASPLAAGTAALLLTGYPEITRDDVLDIMRASCAQIGGVTYTNGRHAEYGFGRISASGALALAGSIPVITAPTPSSVVVGSTLTISGSNFYGNVNPALAGGQSLFATLTPSAGGAATSLTLTKTATLNGTTGLNTITLSGTVPTSLSGGSYNLVVTSPAGESASHAITILTPEIIVEQPAGSEITNGASVAFGSSAVGTGVPLTFTISNSGSGSLTGVNITKDGSNPGDFSISALSPASSTIASGASATFTVTFTPAAAGARSAVLHISSNDADESPYDITLSGTGLARIVNVTSPSSNAYYIVGNTIPITVTFSDAVTVTGTPTLVLNSGGTATYTGGSGTTSLTFSYTVGAGQDSADLDYASTSALSLNGGTIIGSGGSAAVLTLPSPGSVGSLGYNKAIIIDTTAPVATITPSGTHTRTAILFTISFSEPVSDMLTGDITITGGTKSTFTAVNSTTYTVAVTSPVQGTVTCTLANNAAKDMALNFSAGTSASVTYDTVVPTITVSSPSPLAANSSGTIQYTVTYADLHFDESTLVPGNITLTGTATTGVIVGVSGSGTTRTVTLSNLTGNGTLGISVAAGTASDLAGNLAPLKASTVSATIDNVAPVVTTNTALLAANAATVTIAGSGFSATEANNTVTFDNSATGTVTSSTATAMTVTFGTKPEVAGPLTVIVTDLAGNSSSPTVIRTVKPVVTVNTASIEASETSITINGFGFDWSPGNNSVTFSGAALTGTYTPSSSSPTSLTITGITTLMPGVLNAVVTSNGVSSGTAVQVAAVTMPADMVGRFAGVVPRLQPVNGGHGGMVDLTIASNGTVTGTLKFGSQSASFTGSVAHNDVFTINRTLSIAAISGYAARDALSMNLEWYGGYFYGTAADGDFKELEIMPVVYEPLDNPRGLVVAADGTIYVADTGRHQVLKVDPFGATTVFAGITDTAGNADGAPGVGTLSSPCGLALDASTGILWVADSGNNSVRHIDTTTGNISTTSGITGLSQPVGVALNATTVFVLEKGAHRIKRRAKASGTVTILAGSSTGVSGSTATTFKSPEGLAINAAGTQLFVADTGNHCIRKVTIPASGLGTVTVYAGAFNSQEDVNGLPTVARFNAPTAVAVDANGGVWVADTGNLALKLIANSGITSEHIPSYTSPSPMDLRSLAIASDGAVHGGENGLGVERAVETANPIIVEYWAEPKAVEPLPSAARINSFLGTGGSYTRADGVTVVPWGSGYASFTTAVANTYSMAGRLPDGTSVTSSGILTTYYLPFHSVYTVSGSTWQASIQGNCNVFVWDPGDGVIQELWDPAMSMRKTPEPAATIGTNLLDTGIPEHTLEMSGCQYKNLAQFNASLLIDPATTPNATFYASAYDPALPWNFDVAQPIRFTTTTITEPAPNTNTLALGLDAATGVVTGSFTPPGTAAATVNALLIPGYGGYGSYLMGSAMSGNVLLWY